jgi:Uma2 family endonuclease
LFGVPEYWVVDPDAGAIEVWDLAAGARESVRRTLGDSIRWALRGSTAVLEIAVGEILAPPA